ncbi:unnamed protein product [Tenebrio molitor]|nr:unnamed protein product [Tenebrio molitor]
MFQYGKRRLINVETTRSHLNLLSLLHEGCQFFARVHFPDGNVKDDVLFPLRNVKSRASTDTGRGESLQ